ncbi:uncharacterized protein LOC131619065 [Vicia villosa]|uniref:uncharacterized protein LOC131619065 n=1 Tax=Vicia villosa TaxID=3911 RepID=UPI00273C8D22|nr:uncharacterized protein LOC131619065 [Vicia villosa]
MAWKKCYKNIKDEGLGLISLKHYNNAANIQLCWLFLNNNQSWSSFLLAELERETSLSITPSNLLSGKGRSFSLKNVENSYLSLKQAYDFITKPASIDLWSNFPWDKDTAPTHSMLVWRLIHNRIPTDENLQLCGIQFPSTCSLCQAVTETSTHLFFEYPYASKIWTWISVQLQQPYTINKLADCLKIMKEPWSPQALAVVKASFSHTINQLWKAINLFRFDNKVTHWKNCISNIAARAKLVGNHTSKKANGSLVSFSMLKAFGINLHPRSQLDTFEILWCPPAPGWIKCNTDGVASGSPLIVFCGGIYRNDKATHLLSFSAFFNEGSPVFAEFMAAVIDIEKAKHLKLE